MKHGTAIARSTLALALAAGVLGLGSAPASAARLDAPAVAAPPSGAYVDPQLLDQLGGPAVPMIFAWDDERATHEQMAAHLKGRGIEAHLFSTSTGYACAASLTSVRAIAAAPGMRSVFANRELEPALKKSVPTAFNGDPRAVWQGLGVTGKGVGIAVLDTGIDARHPDLAFGTRVTTNVRFLLASADLMHKEDPCPNVDLVTPSMEDTELTSGHGTHIASVAAGDGTASGGRHTGVAPEARLVGVGISDTVTPRGKPANVQKVSMLGAMSAFDWLRINGFIYGPEKVKVILAGWTMPGIFDEVENPITDVIERFTDQGISVVVPAGNDGPQQSDCSAEATCHFNLAGVRTAIAVGAGPRDIRGVLESYSSRGDPVERTFGNPPETARFEPTLVAPGSDVIAARRIGLAPLAVPDSPNAAHGTGRLTTDPDYLPLTGTSVAAAHVAGAVALMQQAAVEAKGCYLSNDQVKEVLQATATPMPGYQRWAVGAGMIDITAAVNRARFVPKIDLVDPDPWICPGLGNK